MRRRVCGIWRRLASGHPTACGYSRPRYRGCHWPVSTPPDRNADWETCRNRAHHDKARISTMELGILPSYIGFETATSSANLTLTRSLLAENSPYFMTGVKYTYKPSDKWQFSGLITNGWQRINKPDKSISPALGSQLVYKPSVKSLFNWSTYVGKELYNNRWGMRYFSNLYWD